MNCTVQEKQRIKRQQQNKKIELSDLKSGKTTTLLVASAEIGHIMDFVAYVLWKLNFSLWSKVKSKVTRTDKEEKYSKSKCNNLLIVYLVA